MAASILSGSLQEIPLPDIIRLLQSTRRTGELVLVCDDSAGSIYLQGGEIVDCQSSRLSGMDALKHVALFSKGEFKFGDGLVSSSRTLAHQPTADSILGLEARFEESCQIRELMPASDETPQYIGGTIPASLEVSASDLAVAMKASSGTLSVERLAHELQLDLLVVRYAIARFRAVGLMNMVASAPPLAEEVSEPVTEPAPASPPPTGGQPRYWRGRKIG